jgi:hypothetical protein
MEVKDILIALISMVLTGLAIFLIFVYVGEHFYNDRIANNTIYNTTIFNNVTNIISYFPSYSFQIIADNLANERSYKLNGYNCVNYSNELVRRLDQAGYDAMTIDGQLYYENGSFKGFHRWVELKVIIEATTGEIIPIEDYYLYQK